VQGVEKEKVWRAKKEFSGLRRIRPSFKALRKEKPQTQEGCFGGGNFGLTWQQTGRVFR